MNYQPFLEMNLLLSDQLLSELHFVLPYFILLLVTSFYLLMFLHYFVFAVISRFVSIRRRRVSASNGNVESLL